MEENELIPVDNNNAVEYTDDNIRHLSDMEHVRTRPGMYIGRLGDGAHAEDGIYVLLKEVIDNSIDEFKMQAGKKIEIIVEENLRVSVRDYGRGIPQGARRGVHRDCPDRRGQGDHQRLQPGRLHLGQGFRLRRRARRAGHAQVGGEVTPCCWKLHTSASASAAGRKC